MLRLRLLFLLFLAVAPVAAGQSDIGIVVMHGKGGSPMGKHIVDFVQKLESHGFRVANIEMPWSRNRSYDVPVSRAEEEVTAAVAGLRGKGASKVFIAGHSQGGGFLMHYAGRHGSDGIILIAPGGDVAARVFSQQVAQPLALARKLVADGKGAEPAQLSDFEGSRGVFPVVSPPSAYVTWFDPDGAMNIPRSAKAVDPKTPVLFVMPTDDYPILLKTNPWIYSNLPRNPLTRAYRPSSDHLWAPSASVDEIVRWTKEVAAARP